MRESGELLWHLEGPLLDIFGLHLNFQKMLTLCEQKWPLKFFACNNPTTSLTWWAEVYHCRWITSSFNCSFFSANVLHFSKLGYQDNFIRSIYDFWTTKMNQHFCYKMQPFFRNGVFLKSRVVPSLMWNFFWSHYWVSLRKFRDLDSRLNF